MPIEQRVVGGGQKIGGGKIGGGAAAKEAPAPEPEPAKKSKKKLVLVIGAVVLVLAGAAAYVLLGMGGGEAEAAEPAPEPGAVVAVEPISLNLAQGHYLRLGFSLQMTLEAGGHGEPDPGKAVDAAIALFSGRTVAEVSDPATRETLKGEFLHELEELYHGEVMDVYLTNYVTQ
jgi:flagellar FliL protein